MGKIRPRQLTEFLEIIWRRKGIAILIAGGMLLATFLVIERLPDVYESRGMVIVAAKNGDDLQIVMTQITAATQQLTSQTNLNALVRKLNIYPSLSTDEAITKLQKTIKTETKFRGFYPDGPESFTISYRHTDPRIAQNVMTELVSVFDFSNANARKQASEELQAVHNELTQVEQQLQQITNANAQENANRPAKTKLDAVAVNTQRFTTSAAIASLNDKQFGLEKQIANLKKQIDDQQKMVKRTAPPANPRNAQGPLLVRKAELEASLKEYATQYTEKNPKVQQARIQLAEVNRQLATLTANNDVDPATVVSIEAQELRTQQRELARLETEIEVTERELERKKQFLATLPILDPTTAFTREESPGGQTIVKDFSSSVYSSLSERHKSLLTRQERLQKVLMVGPGIFQVMDQPTVSQKPVAPNRKLLQLLGLAVALCIGCLIALALEIPQVLRLQDERDVEYFLGTPILAMIPETLAPAEGNRVQRLHFARGILLVFGAALLVPVFYFALDFVLKSTNLFQFIGNR